MALIKCKECNREISDRAEICPFCGCPNLFDVILTAIGPNRYMVIKSLIDILGLGLIEAKELVDGTPKAVVKDVYKAYALAIIKYLEKVGAIAEIK